MRKFLILLKKEIRELLTLQIILPLIITSVLFGFIGRVMSDEQEKAKKPLDVIVLNEDSNNAISNQIIDILNTANLNVELLTDVDVETALFKTRTENKAALFVIPNGFEKSITELAPLKIGTYTIIRDLTLLGGRNYSNLMTALVVVNESFSNSLLSQKISGVSPEVLKNPIQVDEFIVVGDKKANMSPAAIMGFVSQQTLFIPVILFMVVVFASQMIATAIANEKENKTLETLLTTPISRHAIVVAKMTAAGLIALLSSGVYMIGFKSYINGVVGSEEASSQIGEVMSQLGLTFTPQNYLLLGLSLFIGILVALAISLILGSFAEDVKSVAGLTTPVMVLVMIPYFFTMFIDLNNMSPIMRYAVYAIPFSHIFLAAPNLYLHNYSFVIYGIIYQLIVFIIFVIIAAKIFSTDKIVTMKLNFSKKTKKNI